jgi:hypothetical protein
MNPQPTRRSTGAGFWLEPYRLSACGAVLALCVATGIALAMQPSVVPPTNARGAPAVLPTSLIATSHVGPGAVQEPWRSPVADIVKWSAVAGDAAASAEQQPWRSPVADIVRRH